LAKGLANCNFANCQLNLVGTFYPVRSIKAKQHWPYQFNRQFIIDDYIVDFVCRRLKFIIEIDGSSHIAKSDEDFKRQQFLESLGFTILRFPESLVVYRIDEVVSEIDYAIQCLEQKIVDEQ